MAKKSKNENLYDFTGLPIDELITKPLISIIRAQEKMSKEQIRELLKSCFHYNGEYYKPIMLKMSLTRAVIHPGKEVNEEPKLDHITTYFNLPLITLFPFNSLGINEVNIDFEMEITSQYTLDIDINEDDDEDHDNTHNQTAWDKKTTNIEMLGKISPKNTIANNKNTNINASYSKSLNASYSIDVNASPLPLTKGLLAILDAYTKAIEPIEMPIEDNKKEK